MSLLKVKPSPEVYHHYKNHGIAYSGDAGIDLFFPKNVNVKPKSTVIIDLEVVCSMENSLEYISYYIYPRSSIVKTPLIMANSVAIIDSMYRGSLKVAVFNNSDGDFLISSGTRLFQICDPCLRPIKVEVVNNMDCSTRTGSFGSSGI